MSNKIRVAIAGVGNCANSLVQGVHYYRDAADDTDIPGLMHVRMGEYHVGDVEFVAAFDVDSTKVGHDLSKAIWSGQNNTIRFSDTPDLGVTVQSGGEIVVAAGGSAYSDTIQAGGLLVIAGGGIASGVTVSSGATLNFGGNVSSSITISPGAAIQVASGLVGRGRFWRALPRRAGVGRHHLRNQHRHSRSRRC